MKQTLLLIFTLLATYLFHSCNTTPTEVDLISSPQNNLFLIPVIIKGKSYSFQFNTGSAVSFMDYKLARALGFEEENSQYVEVQLLSKVHKDTVLWANNIDLKIGNISMKTNFLLDGYASYMLPYDSLSYVGIIGQDIISRYHWLFDFKHRKLKISYKSINIPTQPTDDITTMKFTINNGGIPDINLKINKDTTCRFLFNTGDDFRSKYSMRYIFSSAHTVRPDFIFSDSLYVLLNEKYGNTSIEWSLPGAQKTLLLDSLQIDGKTYYLRSASYKPDYIKYDNYITANFAYRFRLMYYNSKDQKISFYVSPQDSTFIYTGKGEQEFIKDVHRFFQKHECSYAKRIMIKFKENGRYNILVD